MNQEQNNFNIENNNIENNNEINNNPDINSTFNQNIQSNVNVKEQTFTNQTQPMSNYQQPTNQIYSEQPKKINLGLIIGIIIIVIVAFGIGTKLLFNKNVSKNNKTNKNSDIVYLDNSRNIKASYTFSEATSKFAFKEYETTLIFQQKGNIKLDFIDIDNNNKMSPHFYYEHGESYESFTFEESESSTLNEFVEKFKNGNLDRSSLSFNNIKILELNDEYAFTFGENAGKNYYYFAKKIGNRIFYAYYSYIASFGLDISNDQLLGGFKELFQTLSVDDNKEPYIYDKIINVPIVLNKKIGSYKYIGIISLSPSINSKYDIDFFHKYTKGYIRLREIDYYNNYDPKHMTIHYDAEEYYNKTGWDKDINSKMKYEEVGNSSVVGIKDNNTIQLFQLDPLNIDNEKSFNEYINKFFK